MTSIPRGMIRHGTGTVQGRVIGYLLFIGGLLAAATAPSPARAQHVILKVNGDVITDYDIEQRAKFDMLANHKSTPRQQIIETLIDDKLKAQTAKRYKIDLTDKDVDSQYADMAKRMHMKPEQLTDVLGKSGVNATTLKAKILADMSWQYIIRGKFQQELQIDDKSINTEVESQKKGAGDDVGYDYTLRPILLLVPTGNTPLMETRRKDAEALRAQFTSCDTGLPAARAQRDVVIRATIIKNSSDLVPALREILNKIEVGHLTPPETTEQGVEMYAVCEKKETKSETPEKRAAKEKLFSAKFEKKSKDYLRELRRGAMIEYIQ